MLKPSADPPPLPLVRLLLLGIGAALGLAFWPVLLPLLALALISAALSRGGTRPTARATPPQSPTATSATVGPVLDPQVRARALEEVRRINTEMHREQLERLFEQR